MTSLDNKPNVTYTNESRIPDIGLVILTASAGVGTVIYGLKTGNEFLTNTIDLNTVGKAVFSATGFFVGLTGLTDKVKSNIEHFSRKTIAISGTAIGLGLISLSAYSGDSKQIEESSTTSIDTTAAEVVIIAGNNPTPTNDLPEVYPVFDTEGVIESTDSGRLITAPIPPEIYQIGDGECNTTPAQEIPEGGSFWLAMRSSDEFDDLSDNEITSLTNASVFMQETVLFPGDNVVFNC